MVTGVAGGIRAQGTLQACCGRLQPTPRERTICFYSVVCYGIKSYTPICCSAVDGPVAFIHCRSPQLPSKRRYLSKLWINGATRFDGLSFSFNEEKD